MSVSFKIIYVSNVPDNFVPLSTPLCTALRFHCSIMSLPPSFASATDYFEECLAFLRDNQHLYNFQNIKLLSSDCLEMINLDGLEQIHWSREEVTLQEMAKTNSQIECVMTKADRLTARYDGGVEDNEDVEVEAPLGVKKAHEIKRLAREISEICLRAGCDTVVDFGSGLVSKCDERTRIGRATRVDPNIK